MKRMMPEIVNVGMYDASLVHKNAKSTKNRRVHMYEIEYILADGGTSYIEDHAYPIKKHGIICAKPGQIRHTDLGFKCLYIHFIVEDETFDKLLKTIPDFHIPEKPQLFEKAMRAHISAFASPDTDGGLTVMSTLFELISLLIHHTRYLTNKNQGTKNNATVINNALNYINENFCNPITLQDIANHVHLSKIYFHNLFIAAVGQTTHSYIQAKRFEKAKKMLMTTDKSFSEIALECGFSSQSYLNYAFKKEMNCTPRQFKKESSIKY